MADDLATPLARFDIGEIESIRPLSGGTANQNWRVDARGGVFVLRRRSQRYSSPKQVERDHRLKKFLADSGLPVAIPLRTSSGATCVIDMGATYELYRYFCGDFSSSLNECQLLETAGAIAKLHSITAEYDGRQPFFSSRMDRPADLMSWLDEIAATVTDSGTKKNIRRLEGCIEEVEDIIPDTRWGTLPHAVIHGDVHPANMVFRGDKLAGLFDLDCSSWQPRLRDLADIFLFCAARRKGGFDPTDVITMTKPCAPNEFLFSRCLSGYVENLTPVMTDLERELLPWATVARWISCRLDAKRKIPKSDWPTLIDDGFISSLNWMASGAAL